jgi:LysR family transcriptional regulator of abg operon
VKPNLKLHHLRDFVAIGQHLTVRGAARALGLAQPAVTRSLRELERELGASLVERHARGVVLTPAGERFLLRAHSAVEEVRRAGEEVAQLGGSTEGQVAAALSMAPMLAMLPSALRGFRLSHPAVHLRLIEGAYPTVESRLLDGQLDFYIGPAPERLPRELRSELCFKNERMVVARRQHPLLGARNLADLVDSEWILTGLRERVEQEFEELFSAYALPAPRALIRVESTLGLLSILGSIDAFALLPRQWIDSPMFKTILGAVPVRERLLAPDIVLITRAGVPLTPVAERLALLLQRAAGQPYPSPMGTD